MLRRILSIPKKLRQLGRVTGCRGCGRRLVAFLGSQCQYCHWIRCPRCGACGCGGGKYTKRKKGWRSKR